MLEKAHKITTPNIIPRSDHNVSRASISENALKVLYRLKEAGYEAYLVGGGVRDMLLGREPKDFDVSTNATPEQVKDVFRNCRLIGRRFRLAHVFFHGEIIEVSTFRGHHDDTEAEIETESEEGRILRDNVYGTLEEDVWRRDFTVNALYYNIYDYSIVDYTGGVADLNAGVLRIIGDPEKRFREDPVRMLRAVRFSAKLGLKIEEQTAARIFELAHLLGDISSSRLFEEVLKMFHAGCAHETFEMLRHYGLFAHLFPLTEKSLENESEHFPLMLLINALKSTDKRIAEGKPVTPAFLIAALLWDPMQQRAKEYSFDDMSEIQRMHEATADVFRNQREHTSIPRRFALTARDIWTMQPRLAKRSGKRAFRLFTHPRFRAAYDFLLLRAESGEDVSELADWWTKYQEVDAEEREKMVRVLTPKGKKKKRKKPQPQNNEQ
ncbi:MAG: polynucleotide adenylyltransferase PcnB [Gammaproteobacteria bacterium]|nr:polynucleotide adenylyltransferase PcnB [Gammaproteobacteria bacterium]MDH5592914.1 polynucleotide adenylyltransferase PcnB [Gammaproteobacteria bacterium]